MPDPQGQARWRWFDGEQWTSTVSDSTVWDGRPDHPESVAWGGYISGALVSPVIGLIFLTVLVRQGKSREAVICAYCCLFGAVSNLLLIWLLA